MDYLELIEKLRERMAEGQVDKVMEALGVLREVEGLYKDVKDELILLLARYNTWLADKKNGLKDPRELKTEGTRLKKDTISFFNVLEKEKVSGWEKYIDRFSQTMNIPYDDEYETTRPNSLGKIFKDKCDRDEQNDMFLQKFNKLDGKYFKFYCLVGEEKQSHEGLFRRFFHEYLKGEKQKHSRMVRLHINRTQSVENIQSDFLYKLLSEFHLADLLTTNQDPCASMEKWFNHLQAKQQMERVAIDVRFSSNYWNPHIMDFVEWLQNEYCKEDKLLGEKPLIHIFFSFVMEPSVMAALGLPEEGLGANAAHDAMRKAVPQLEGSALVFQELEAVPVMEVIEWIQESKIETDPTSAVNVFKAFFPEPKQFYDMKFVEERLEKIIEAYNQGDLWQKIKTGS